MRLYFATVLYLPTTHHAITHNIYPPSRCAIVKPCSGIHGLEGRLRVCDFGMWHNKLVSMLNEWVLPGASCGQWEWVDPLAQMRWGVTASKKYATSFKILQLLVNQGKNSTQAEGVPNDHSHLFPSLSTMNDHPSPPLILMTPPPSSPPLSFQWPPSLPPPLIPMASSRPLPPHLTLSINYI